MKKVGNNACYDSSRHRLVHCGAPSSQYFWDRHWMQTNIGKLIRIRSRFIEKETIRYLKPGSRILEGGCGRGQNVWTLQHAGYEAIGIDYAANTIKMVHANAPELAVLHGDLEHLPFLSGSFDGYWSLGVIEHFFDGYQCCLSEINRVLRHGGFAFITFPAMNWLRAEKIRYGRYLIIDGRNNELQNEFYQFILDPESVIEDFRREGFALLLMKKLDGVKGLKDEIALIRPALQRLYDSKRLIYRICKKLIDIVINPVAGHMTYLVFRKIK